MPRKGVSKADIMSSIQVLLDKSEVPTAASIRSELGRGSLTTIQKHFRNWKIDLFARRSEGTHKTEVKGLERGEFAKELNDLRSKQLEMEQQYQMLAQELIKKEKEALKYTQENLQLSQNLQEITEKHKELWLNYQHLTERHEDLKQERETSLKKVLEDKNQQIARLSGELKEVNETYLNAIKEVGQKGDESLIQEKVKTIHLSDQLKEVQLQNKQLIEQLAKEGVFKGSVQKQQSRSGALSNPLMPAKPFTSFGPRDEDDE